VSLSWTTYRQSTSPKLISHVKTILKLLSIYAWIFNVVFILYVFQLQLWAHAWTPCVLRTPPIPFSSVVILIIYKRKGKAVPLQAWTGPEGSRKLRFQDFVTTAQDGGEVVSLTHRPPLPQEMFLVLISVGGWVDPRAIVRSEGFYVNEKFQWPAEIEPATYKFVSQHLNHCATAVPHFCTNLA